MQYTPLSLSPSLPLSPPLQVLGSTILEQVFIVEYIVHYQMCDECHRREAKDFWRAVVQVRQKVGGINCRADKYYIIMMSLVHSLHTRRHFSTWSSWYWSTTPTTTPSGSRSPMMASTSFMLGSRRQGRWWTFCKLWSLAGIQVKSMLDWEYLYTCNYFYDPSGIRRLKSWFLMTHTTTHTSTNTPSVWR